MITEKELLEGRLALRPDEAADALGVGRNTLFDLIRSGELESIKISHKTRVIPVKCIHDYLDRKIEESRAEREAAA